MEALVNSRKRTKQKPDSIYEKQKKKRKIANNLMSLALIILLSGIALFNIQEARAQEYPYADGLNQFTDAEINQLRSSFRIPDNILVTGISCSDPYYWEGAGLMIMSVSLYSGDQMLAGASVDPETLEHMRNIYLYSDENVDLSKVVYQQAGEYEPAATLSDEQRITALDPMIRAYVNSNLFSREAGEKDLGACLENKDDFWSLIYIYAIYDDSRSSSGGKRTYNLGELRDIAYAMVPGFDGSLPDYPDSYYSGGGGVILGSDTITFYLASPEEQRFRLDRYRHLDDGGLELRYLQEWDPYTVTSRKDSYFVAVLTKPYQGQGNAAYRFGDTVVSIRYERDGAEESNAPYQSSGNNAAAGDYILPGSDSRYISASELSGMDSATLRLARNELYARHGRRFNSSDLQSYFDGKAWYFGTISPEAFSESVFNTYEKENLKLIQNTEAALK